MVVYDRQGKQVAYWDTVMTYDMTCESCLSINSDGSRFVVATRKDGGWKAQVYNVVADKVYLLYEQAISSTFLGKASEVRVALSPDGLLLAYGAGDGDTSVLDLNSLQPAFHYAAKGVTGLAFTPDGVSFMARRGRDMLFWKTAKWGIPVNVLLPGDDTPYAFSPDGKLLAIAASAGPRIYHLDTLKPGAEINFPPTGTTNRLWQLSFSDATTLHAYGVRWNAAYTSATVDQGQWNAETGEQLKTDTSTTDTIDALSALWGTAIQSSSPPGDVEIGQYRRLAFVSHDTLLVAGIHTACWLKLSSGDKTCFFDGQNAVVTSDVGTYHEVLQTNHTVLQDWNGGKAFEVSPYRILALNKNADYVVINVKDATTDIYFRTKNKLVQSLPGTLSTFTEFGTRMALATNKSGVGYVTLIDEGSIAALFQKKDQHFLKPIAIDAKSNVYTLQAYPDQAQVVLGMISGPDYQLTVVGHLPMPAQPEIMALCGVTGLFAIGMDDGSVLLVSPDGKQTALFQAAHSPIGGLAFIGDGRYLAVGSAEGVKVFAILPQ